MYNSNSCIDRPDHRQIVVFLVYIKGGLACYSIPERTVCRLMSTAVIWRRNHLHLPRPFDTIFFDVDGILINVVDSFHATDIAVAEYVAGMLNGLSWGQEDGEKLLTLHDVELFKQAGGYNNDWDMCFLLSTLATALLRKWRGTSLAERTTTELAELSRAANLRGRGGLIWVRDTFPASA